MTIASAARGEVDYVATGASLIYAYTFPVFDEEHLQVLVVSPADVVHDLTLSTDGSTNDYTVSGVRNGTGGNVTLLSNGQAWITAGFLTAGWTIMILRTVPLTQLANLRGEGGYKPETNEQEMDLLTMALQQVQDQVDRCVQIPTAELPADFTMTLPAAAARANLALGFDSNGDITVITGGVTGGFTSTYVLYAGTNGLPTGSAGFIWTDTTKKLTLTGSVGPQLRLGYDGSKYADMQLVSNGDLYFTFSTAASSGVVLQSPSNCILTLYSVTNGLASVKYWTNGTFRFKSFVADTLNQYIIAPPDDNSIFLCDANKNVVIGYQALATNATDGFFYIPTCAGAPTGVPTVFTGRWPMVFDSVNNFLYFNASTVWTSSPQFNNLWKTLIALNTNQYILTANASLCWGSSGLTSPDVFIGRRAAGVLSQENGANAQEFRVYGNTTGPKYLSMSHNGTDAIITPTSGDLNLYGAAAVVNIVNGTTAQALRIYGTTSSSKYLSLSHDGTNAIINPSSGSITFSLNGTAQANVVSNQWILTANASICWGSSGVATPDVFVGRRAANTLSLENSTNAQAFRIYGNTSGAIYLNIAHNGTNAIISPVNGNQLAFATAALATNATIGFTCIATCAGTPTGTPANIPTGQTPIIYDSTNNKLYFYIGGAWKRAQVTAVDAIYA